MTSTEKNELHFTYDPIALTKTLLEMYAERYIEKQTFKARQYSIYEYLRLQTDEECQFLVEEHAKRAGLTEITYKEWVDDCQAMISIIEETDKYKEILFKHQCMGQGETGYGIVDKSDNTFYECRKFRHWEAIRDIIKEKYLDYYEPLIEMSNQKGLDKYNNISRKEIDDFILENFELVGNGMPADFYIS